MDSRALELRTVALAGGPLAYRLRHSPRSRGLRVSIDPRHDVVVSVPPASRRGWARPEARIESFLAVREGWIRRHLARLEAARAEVRARGGIRDGARLRFRGGLHRLRIREATPGGPRRSIVERRGDGPEDELIVVLGTADRRSVRVILEADLRARARAAIDRAVAAHADGLGVRPARITLRDPRSRWGSAARTGRLSFSWRLILAPPEALETVVVHELAHLRVFGHGPEFWHFVASRVPEHARWRRWLRAHAVELHAALDGD